MSGRARSCERERGFVVESTFLRRIGKRPHLVSAFAALLHRDALGGDAHHSRPDRSRIVQIILREFRLQRFRRFHSLVVRNRAFDMVRHVRGTDAVV